MKINLSYLGLKASFSIDINLNKTFKYILTYYCCEIICSIEI